MERIQRSWKSFVHWFSPQKPSTESKLEKSLPGSRESMAISKEKVHELGLSHKHLSLLQSLDQTRKALKGTTSKSPQQMEKEDRDRSLALSLLAAFEDLAKEKPSAKLTNFYRGRLEVLEKQVKGCWNLQTLTPDNSQPLAEIHAIRTLIEAEQKIFTQNHNRSQSLTLKQQELETEIKKMGAHIPSKTGTVTRIRKLRSKLQGADQTLTRALKEADEVLKKEQPDKLGELIDYYFDLTTAAQMLKNVEEVASQEFSEERTPAAVTAKLNLLRKQVTRQISEQISEQITQQISEQGIYWQAQCQYVISHPELNPQQKRQATLILIEEAADQTSSDRKIRPHLTQLASLFPVVIPEAWNIFQNSQLTREEKVGDLLGQETDYYFREQWEKGQAIEKDGILLILRFLQRQIDPKGIFRLRQVDRHPTWSPVRKANTLAYLERLLSHGPWRISRKFHAEFNGTMHQVLTTIKPVQPRFRKLKWPDEERLKGWLTHGEISAHHLTQIAHDLFFCHANLFDALANEELAQPHFDKKSATFKAVTAHFDRLSGFITDLILTTLSPSGRACAITNWVGIAQALIEQGDLFGAFSICSGVNHSQVERLATTLTLLSKETAEARKKLQHLFSPDRAFKNLHRFQRDQEAVFIPPVHEIAKHLTFSGENEEEEHKALRLYLLSRLVQHQQAIRFAYQHRLKELPLSPLLPAIAAHKRLPFDSLYHLSIAKEPN